uniref:BED-type domain-containing protein n=1 Tax=Pectinophora gossypiella TaxID=13191 RepID=A0A1E1WIR6_PECGO
MKHLRGKHGYTRSELKGDEDGTEGDTENEDKEETKQNIKSEIWEYFDTKDEDEKVASCRLCLDQFSYKTSLSKLSSHLKSKHSIDFGKGSDDEDYKGTDDEDVSLAHLSESRGRGKSSEAWEYFEIKDDERKVARCNLCGALCSYRTSVSNLMKHARRKHNMRPRTSDCEEDPGDDHHEDSKVDTSVSRAQRSIVWLYFKCVDPDAKLSQCMICKKLLSHSTTLTNLKKHLERKHPNVKIPVREDGRKRILLSSGGELYEVEAGTKLDDDDDDDMNANDDVENQNDTLEMDTVYLEDFESLEESQKNRKPSTKKRVRNNTYSSSSEEEVTFINRYVKKHSDSFDHFGKYIASLLRKLPKETSSRLQADFVKQILSVESVTDKNNAYEVIVHDDSQDFVAVAVEGAPAK